jgi:hypothetical protein
VNYWISLVELVLGVRFAGTLGVISPLAKSGNSVGSPRLWEWEELVNFFCSSEATATEIFGITCGAACERTSVHIILVYACRERLSINQLVKGEKEKLAHKLRAAQHERVPSPESNNFTPA